MLFLDELKASLEEGLTPEAARQLLDWVTQSSFSLTQKVELRNLIFQFKDQAYSNPDLLLVWAKLESELGMQKVAYELLQALLSNTPNHVEGLRAMAALCVSSGANAEALSAFKRLTDLNPCDSDAWNDGGCVLRAMGNYDESMNWMRKACEASPQHSNLYANLALLHLETHEWDECQAALDRALLLDVDNPQALHTQGMLYARLGKYEQAREAENRALAIQPDYPQVRLSLALLDLISGDWEKGFAGYESRWVGSDKSSVQGMPTVCRPRWQGQYIYPGSRIAVLSEQGLGDVIQFARFVQDLLQIFSRVDWVVPQPLLRLMESSFSDEPRLALHVSNDSLPLHLIDYECPSMSLPLALGLTLERLSTLPSYLKPSTETVARFSPLVLGLTQPLKVGLAWSGRPTLSAHALRSVSPDLLTLLDHPEIAFINLQKSEAEFILAPKMHNWYDCMDYCSDFEDTAGLVSQLDLVISTDTSIAHLAGALGVPVWLLNRKGSEWRWLHDRVDTPWYPSMTLFNQQSYKDWKPELNSMAARLKDLLSSKR